MPVVNSDLPFFSVIVPTYGRPQALARCLQALSALDYPSDRHEIIVVNDGGPPVERPTYWATPVRLTLLTQPNSGPGVARNTGAAHAMGDCLAFTDDDCEPEPDWLHALAAGLANTPNAAVGGHTVNALLDNPYANASQTLIDYLYAYYNHDPQNGVFVTSNNLACPVQQFRALGGFDPAFPRAAAEDREFCDRWRHHGFRIIYTPEARVRHSHRLTFRRFWQQHYQYGVGAFTFHQFRAQRGQQALSVEPFTFYWNLLRYPWANGRGPQRLFHVGLAGLTQLANALGFYAARRAFRRAHHVV